LNNIESVQDIEPKVLIIVLFWRSWNVHLNFTTREFGHTAIFPFLGGICYKMKICNISTLHFLLHIYKIYLYINIHMIKICNRSTFNFSLHVYIYIHKYIYVCIIYTFINIYIYIHIHAHIFIDTYTHICTILPFITLGSVVKHNVDWMIGWNSQMNSQCEFQSFAR